MDKIDDNSFKSYYTNLSMFKFWQTDTYKQFENKFIEYDDIVKQIDPKTFTFGVLTSTRKYMFHLINTTLVDYTLDNLEYKEQDLSEYTVFSFGGATINSLLRILYGRHGNTISK